MREKLRNGEIHDINDLITYNLDIRQFAQDVIDTAEGPELLRAFYRAITTVSVLDPTCGSGAFLFAALNILQPLYEACLERMQGFVDDLDRSEEKPHPEKFKDFRETLAQVAKHFNHEYFIYKSIILNNLYGVDIMEEATEICKLRLFLKLVSQVEVNPSAQNMGLEPLPDIDFNIRAGNTLVGFATLEEVRRAITQDQVKSKRSAVVSEEAAQFKLEFGDDLSRINEAAEIADRAYQMFRQMQTQEGMNGKAFAEAKQEVRRRLKELNEELNTYLAKEYLVDHSNSEAYQRWLKTHQPFHWLIEFHKVIKSGGFDVLIGNPPYVEYSKVINQYQILDYATFSCKNLYAYVLERCLAISGTCALMGMIIPLSAFATDRMNPLLELVHKDNSLVWTSNFGVRPAKLFDGVNWRLSVLISSRNSCESKKTLLTKHQRWYSEERESRFQVLEYCDNEAKLCSKTLPKYSQNTAKSILSKIHIDTPRSRFNFSSSKKKTKHYVHYQEATQYWIKAMSTLPFYEKNGKVSPPAHARFLYFSDEKNAKLACAILNSSLFYFYFNIFSDCYHLGDALVRSFPIALTLKDEGRVIDLAERLMQDLEDRATIQQIKTGNGDVIRYALLTYTGSKNIIDQIDHTLAFHYGFTDEELDFIINYDIKYRMGPDGGNAEDK